MLRLGLLPIALLFFLTSPLRAESPHTHSAAPCPEGVWTQYTRASGGPDNDYINDLALDSSGRLLVATNDLHKVETFGGGLSIRDPGDGWRNIRASSSGLDSDTVYSVFPTENGFMVGTLEGADRFSFAKSEEGSGEGSERPVSKAESFLPGRAEAESNVDAEVSRGSWTRLLRVPLPPYPLRDVSALLRDRQDTWWFATSYGLFSRSADTWTRYGPEPPGREVDSRFVSALASDHAGRLWVGTFGGGVAIRDPNGRWSRFRSDGNNLGKSRSDGNNLGKSRSDGNNLGKSRSDGNNLGKSRSDGNNLGKSRSDGNNLGNDYIYDIAEDFKGRTWVGTGIGVSVWDGQHWTVFTSRNSPLVEDTVRSIAVDSKGRIWLGTHAGISIVSDLREDSAAAPTKRNRSTKDPDRAKTTDASQATRVLELGWSSCRAPEGTLERFLKGRASLVSPVPRQDALPFPIVVALQAGAHGEMWVGTYGGGVIHFSPEVP